MESSDFEVARRRAERGRRVVRDLYVALRSMASPSTTVTIDAAVQGLATSLAAAWRGDVATSDAKATSSPGRSDERHDVSQLELSVRGHGLCLDGSRIAIESTSFVACEAVRESLARRRVGGLVFELSDGRIDVGELATALRVLGADEVAGDGAAAELRARGVRCVRLMAADLPECERSSASADASGARSSGVTTELRSVYAAKAVPDQVLESRLANPRLAKHVVRAVVDAVLGEPDLIELLAEQQASRASLVRHGAATAVYASWIGRRIGLSSEMIVELGVAALFHDVGRTIEAGDGHTEAGFRRFMGVHGSRLALRAMSVARHHHDRVDDALLGDFDLPTGLAPIVRVADIYDRARTGDGTLTPHADEAALAAVWRAAAEGDVPAVLAQALADVLVLAATPADSLR